MWRPLHIRFLVTALLGTQVRSLGGVGGGKQIRTRLVLVGQLRRIAIGRGVVVSDLGQDIASKLRFALDRKSVV